MSNPASLTAGEIIAALTAAGIPSEVEHTARIWATIPRPDTKGDR